MNDSGLIICNVRKNRGALQFSRFWFGVFLRYYSPARLLAQDNFTLSHVHPTFYDGMHHLLLPLLDLNFIYSVILTESQMCY